MKDPKQLTDAVDNTLRTWKAKLTENFDMNDSVISDTPDINESYESPDDLSEEIILDDDLGSDELSAAKAEYDEAYDEYQKAAAEATKYQLKIDEAADADTLSVDEVDFSNVSEADLIDAREACSKFIQASTRLHTAQRTYDSLKNSQFENLTYDDDLNDFTECMKANCNDSAEVEAEGLNVFGSGNPLNAIHPVARMASNSYDNIISNILGEDAESDISDTRYTCCICNQEFDDFGNDPWPVNTDPDAKCCDLCNLSSVIPARLNLMKKSSD